MTGIAKIATGLLLATVGGIGIWQTCEFAIPRKVKAYFDESSLLDLTEVNDGNTNEHDYQTWKAIIDKSTSDNSKLKAFAEWGEQEPSNEKDKINKLKTKCKVELEKNRSQISHEQLQNIKDFCTKTQSPSES